MARVVSILRMSSLAGCVVRARRYGLWDNLLGPPAFCPVIRLNPRIADYAAADWAQACVEELAACSRPVYQRVLAHLYLSEIHYSWQIEG